MRFGIKTAPQHTTWEDMLAVWRRADDIDIFESAWNFDHFYPIFSDPTGPCLEALDDARRDGAARRSASVSACMVTGNIYRHPAVLANMAATVDVISDGRLELGIGAGWNQQECDAYGIDLPPLERAVRPVRRGMRGARQAAVRHDTTSTGATTSSPTRAVSRSLYSARILRSASAAAGETRTLRAVARCAQHWNVPSGAVAVVPAQTGCSGEHCADDRPRRIDDHDLDAPPLRPEARHQGVRRGRDGVG